MASVISEDLLMVLGGAVFVLVIVAATMGMSILKTKYEGEATRAMLREDNATDLKQLATVLKLLGHQKSPKPNVEMGYPGMWGQAYDPAAQVSNGRQVPPTGFRDTVAHAMADAVDLE